MNISAVCRWGKKKAGKGNTIVIYGESPSGSGGSFRSRKNGKKERDRGDIGCVKNTRKNKQKKRKLGRRIWDMVGTKLKPTQE